MNTGLADVLEGLRRLPMVIYLALGDTRARYRRSMLGPLWLTLGAAVGAAGLGFMWSILLKADRSKLVPSITVGLLLWQFIIGSINESPTVFSKQAMMIRNLQLPHYFHVLYLIVRHFINFLHNSLVIALVLIIFPPEGHVAIGLCLVGLLIIMLNLGWIVLLVGMLGARMRDVEPMVQVLTPILFFLTPVLFRPEHLGINENIVWFNPLSYMVSILRDPLLGMTPPAFVYWASVGAIAVGWGVTLALFSSRHARLAYWV